MPRVRLAGELDTLPAVRPERPGSVPMNRRRERQAREQRRRGVAVRLTDRDRALLEALARFRIARSGDLGRLFFPGRHRDVLMARLRKLYDGSYVEVHVGDRAAENVYSIGPRAKEVVVDGSVCTVPRPPWEHHLEIVRLWCRLAATAHESTRLHLVSFLPEWVLRAAPGVVERAIVPDSLVTVAVEDREVVLAVEVDRGTEGLAVLRRKISAYRSASTLNETTLVVALAGDGLRRVDQVWDLLRAESMSSAAVWTEETELEPEIIRLTLAAEGPVTRSRRGNGMDQHASPEADSASDVTGGGLSESE